MFKLVEFADRLRIERKARGLNQTSFARLGGVGLQSQSRYENADNEPSAEYLANLAQAGIDVVFILTGTRSTDSLNAQETELITHCRTMSDDFVDALAALARAATGTAERATVRSGTDGPHGSTLHDRKIDFRAD